jgi:hypothetical protein
LVPGVKKTKGRGPTVAKKAERRGKRQGQNTGRCSSKKNFRKKVNLDAPVVHAQKRQESLRYLSGDILDS